jgi:hypothetical protein
MQENIKLFVDQVFSINPTVSTVYSSALTVGSRDMAGGGISNSASETVFKLKKKQLLWQNLLFIRTTKIKQL